MANNNNLLFNAAINGFLTGVQTGRSATDIVPAPIVAAAVAFATEVDGKIANDGTISGVAGVTLPPTTAAITAAQMAKVNLLKGITSALLSGRTTTDAVAADYNAVATSAVALYTATLASLAAG